MYVLLDNFVNKPSFKNLSTHTHRATDANLRSDAGSDEPRSDN